MAGARVAQYEGVRIRVVQISDHGICSDSSDIRAGIHIDPWAMGRGLCWPSNNGSSDVPDMLSSMKSLGSL